MAEATVDPVAVEKPGAVLLEKSSAATGSYVFMTYGGVVRERGVGVGAGAGVRGGGLRACGV